MRFLKNTILCLIFILYSECVFCQEFPADKQNRKQVFKIGKTLALKNPELLTFSIIGEYERQVRFSKRFTSNYSFRYDEGLSSITFSGTGQPTITNTFKLSDFRVKYNMRYYPFLLKKESMNLIYFQAGPLYFNRNINGSDIGYGPGFDYGMGVQFILWKRLAISAEGGRAWIVNLNKPSNSKKSFFGTTGRFYNVKIGYVFKSKKKDYVQR